MRGVAVEQPLTAGQMRLQGQLMRALTHALAVGRESELGLQSAHHAYQGVAHALIALRHEFTTSDGRTPDLKGRSSGYRRVVRSAYETVGASARGPIEKRLTAGTAYWVKKLLIVRYGERRLREMGVLQPPRRVVRRALERLSGNPQESLATAADLLNLLVSNHSFSPSEQTLRSVLRAVVLLRRRVACAHQELGAA